jgi:hypothetical protein
MCKSTLFFTALIAVSSFMAHAQDRPQLADVAAKQSIALYRSGGMTAIKINSQDCHKYILDKIYCIYLDTAAQQIDRAVVDDIKFARDPYFDSEQMLDRTGPILIEAGMNMQDANVFLRQSYLFVKLALERHLTE